MDGINADLADFYTNIIGPYWNKERRFIDEAYQTIPFPFEEILLNKSFTIDDNWTIQQLAGYLNTWSSVQRFIQKEGYNPVTPFITHLQSKWPTPTKKISFPILLRIGLIR